MTFIFKCLSKVTKYNIFSRWAYFVKRRRQVSVTEASGNVQVERLTSYLHPAGELPKPVLITAFCTLIQGWQHFHRSLRCVCAEAGKLRLAQLSMRHRGLQPIKPWFKHMHFGGTEQFQRNCESGHTQRELITPLKDLLLYLCLILHLGSKHLHIPSYQTELLQNRNTSRN